MTPPGRVSDNPQSWRRDAADLSVLFFLVLPSASEAPVIPA
jgi:hypothetical protein